MNLQKSYYLFLLYWSYNYDVWASSYDIFDSFASYVASKGRVASSNINAVFKLKYSWTHNDNGGSGICNPRTMDDIIGSWLC